MLVLILAGCIAANGQVAGIKPEKIGRSQIPQKIKFKGRLEEAWRWNDRLGSNILLLSTVPAFETMKRDAETNEIVYTAELHAFHYIKKDSGFSLLWKISDAVKECPFDLVAEFIVGSTTISDLDEDGLAETIVQYKLACRSDVSPAQMKLIMHEDTLKYALRGTMWVKASEEDRFTVTEENMNLENWKDYRGTDEEWEKLFGRYQSEKDFLSASPAFLHFARRQWLKYVKESFE